MEDWLRGEESGGWVSRDRNQMRLVYTLRVGDRIDLFSKCISYKESTSGASGSLAELHLGSIDLISPNTNTYQLFRTSNARSECAKRWMNGRRRDQTRGKAMRCKMEKGCHLTIASTARSRRHKLAPELPLVGAEVPQLSPSISVWE